MAARIFKAAVPAALLLSSLVLTACGSGEAVKDMMVKRDPPACPEVVLLADAERVTLFRPGQGRDVTDVEGGAEISGFRGACAWNGRNKVDVTVAVGFEIDRGPADADGMVAFEYFVAVPDFYPSPAAKAVLPVQVAFPPNVTRVRHVDEEVTLTIPMAEGETAVKHSVYLGFQLTPEQLERNRARQK